MITSKYKRVLIKLSGEALSGESGFGIDFVVVEDIVKQLKKLRESNIDVCIVIGAGNFWRGRQNTEMDRTTADHMGMLATVINCLALQDALERDGIPTRVQTALTITRIAEPYIMRKALKHISEGKIVIFGCGTGNPYFTTDTAAALRAAEMHADVILLAKNIDGIYDSDPRKNPNAKKLKSISYKEILALGLSVIDSTATTLCMENNIPIIAFGLKEANSIVRAISGENFGTLVGI
ncbi:MAG: UMP kinase [Christensenellaceae bacterium]|jgi:uridylate kinase|nr:UMP kinase [Christensenellaceae bacterium]